jgi:hypothetical protein
LERVRMRIVFSGARYQVRPARAEVHLKAGIRSPATSVKT